MTTHVTSVSSEDLFDTSSEGSQDEDASNLDDCHSQRKESRAKPEASSSAVSATERITHSKPTVGLQIEACDKEGIWSLARIVQVQKKKPRSRRQLIKISYLGWGSEWDELVDFSDSKRIAKPGTHTMRFKCMVNLLTGFVSGKCTEWPCVVNVRTPSSLASKAQNEFAQESLRLEQKIFIEPYGMKYLPHEIASSNVYGGRWVNIQSVSEWESLSGVEKKNSKKLANNFYSAYQIALKDDLPNLPENTFTVGTLANKNIRLKSTKPNKTAKSSETSKRSVKSSEPFNAHCRELGKTKKRKRSLLEKSESEKDVTLLVASGKSADGYDANKKPRIEKSSSRKKNSTKSSAITEQTNSHSKKAVASMRRKERDQATEITAISKKSHSGSESGKCDIVRDEANESQMPNINPGRTKLTNENTKKLQNRSGIGQIPRKKRKSNYCKQTDSRPVRTEDAKIPKTAGNDDDAKPDQNKDYLSLLLESDNAKADLSLKGKSSNSIRQQMHLQNPNMFRIPKKHSLAKESSAEVKSKVTVSKQSDAVPKPAEILTKKTNDGAEKKEKLRMMVRSLKERVSKRAPLPDPNDKETRVQQPHATSKTANKPKTSDKLPCKNRRKKSVSDSNSQLDPKGDNIACNGNKPAIDDPKICLEAKGPKPNCIGFERGTQDNKCGLTLWLQKLNEASKPESDPNQCHKKQVSNDTRMLQQNQCRDEAVIAVASNGSNGTFHTELESNIKANKKQESNPECASIDNEKDDRKFSQPIKESTNSGNDKFVHQSNFRDKVSPPSDDSYMSISPSSSAMSISSQSDASTSVSATNAHIQNKATNYPTISDVHFAEEHCEKTGARGRTNKNVQSQETARNVKGIEEMIVDHASPSSESSGCKNVCPKVIAKKTKKKKDANCITTSTMNETPSLSEESKGEDDSNEANQKSAKPNRKSAKPKQRSSKKRTGTTVNETVLMAVMRCQEMMDSSEPVEKNLLLDSPPKQSQRKSSIENDSQGGKAGLKCGDSKKPKHFSDIGKKQSQAQAQEVNEAKHSNNTEKVNVEHVLSVNKVKQIQPVLQQKQIQPVVEQKKVHPPTMTHAQIFAQLKAQRREAKSKVIRRRTLRKGLKKGRSSQRLVPHT